MEREQQIIEQVKQQGLLPLFYHDNSDTCVAVTQGFI